VDYFHANADRFEEPGAWIVCSGGFSASRGDAAIPEEHREGPLMRLELIRQGVPNSLIKVESDSGSTTANFCNCLDAGLFGAGDFSPNSSLGVVTHPQHMQRVRRVTWALGITDVQPILTAEADYSLREIASNMVSTAGVTGAASLRGREELITRLRRSARALGL
jgi:uncharacterized SAM-binding protein YcdF (DUF218 family)